MDVEQTEQNHLQQTIESHMGAIQKLIYAGFFPRFFAYIIDLIVIWSINTIVTRPFLKVTNLADAQVWIELFSASNIATTTVFFAYFVLLTYFYRATLGKMILGLSVETLDGEALTTKQILFREWIGRYISMALFGLPYLVVIFTKRHQGIHDYVADTAVIKSKRKRLQEALRA